MINEPNTQGPVDTDAEKLERLPRVLQSYLDAIERQRVFVIDSDFPHVLRRAVEALEDYARRARFDAQKRAEYDRLTAFQKAEVEYIALGGVIVPRKRP